VQKETNKGQSCDGGNPCSRCAARDVSACEFPVHKQTAKKIMMDKIGHLDHQYKTDHQILRAIVTHEDGDKIVQQLKDGESHEAIARYIQSRSLPESGSSRSRTENPSSRFEHDTISITGHDKSEGHYAFDKQDERNDTAPVSTKLEKERELDHIKVAPDSIGLALLNTDSGRDYRKEDTQASGPGPEAYQSSSLVFRRHQADERNYITESWTNVTADQDLVKYLLDLYFRWEYPTFA
ncbi:MAG: hypothetical protein M1835_003493, partial [Candelina submexicana]